MRAGIASFFLLSSLLGLGIAQASQPSYIPIHGTVLSVPQNRCIVLRMEDVPDALAARTGTACVQNAHELQNLAPGNEIDALLYSQGHGTRLSEITVGREYTAGEPDARIAQQIAVGDLLPDEHFVDQNGREVTLHSLRGKTLILSFFFTKCPDREICPAISGRFAYLQSRIDSEHVKLLEVTLDPKSDSPAVLEKYGRQFATDPSAWLLLTGEQHTIEDSLALFGLSNLETSPGDFIHDDVLALIGPDGRLKQTIATVAWSPDDILATVAQQNGLPANPLRRLELSAIAGIIAFCGGSTTAGVAILDSIVFIAGVLFFGGWLYWFGRKIWHKSS